MMGCKGTSWTDGEVWAGLPEEYPAVPRSFWPASWPRDVWYQPWPWTVQLNPDLGLNLGL